MGRLGCKPLLMLSLLIAVGCGGNAAVSGKGVAPASTPSSVSADATVDTLCLYYQRHWSPKYGEGAYVFQDDAQLTEFLDSTGYYVREDRVTKKILQQPDFEKWTYFGLIGRAPTYGRTIDISYGEDSVTVILSVQVNKSKHERGISVSKPADRVIVYSIPFTEKDIVFTSDMKYIKEKRRRQR